MIRSSISQNRRGAFLIEVVAVITLSILLLGLSVALLQALLRLESREREAMVASSSFSRLARDFRAHVHHGLEARIISLPEPFAQTDWGRLEIDDKHGRVVSFGLMNGHLVREISSHGEAVGREVYRLPRGSTFQWNIRPWMDDMACQLVSLEISPPPPSGIREAGKPVINRVEAILGRDWRLAREKSR